MKRSTIIQAVETEYQRPFWDVVKEFADDSESINATALILGYAHPAPFHRLVTKAGYKHWFKPATETNSYKSAVQHKRMTLKRQQQLRTLHKAHCFIFNGISDTRAGHARRAGLKPQTVTSRLRKGWPLDKALTTPRIAAGYRQRKHDTTLHPWRSPL